MILSRSEDSSRDLADLLPTLAWNAATGSNPRGRPSAGPKLTKLGVAFLGGAILYEISRLELEDSSRNKMVQGSFTEMQSWRRIGQV